MARQNYLIYNDTDPFDGFIYQNFVGRLDPNESSNLKTMLENAAGTDANMHLVYLPFSEELPNSDTHKYDSVSGALAPLIVSEVTNTAAFEEEQQSLKAAMLDLVNNTSYSDIEGIIDAQFSDHSAGQRNILKKLTTICLHYGKKVVR